MNMEATACNGTTFVPFSDYDWTFARKGWLPWNPAAYCFIASFCAIAYWMSIELLILVYITFKRHTGLYFWSIIITTFGIILQTTGFILKSFENDTNRVVVLTICKIGWVSNVTGFSIVLWSRLHLVVNSPRLLRYLIIIILLNGFCCHTPLIVMEYGLLSKDHSRYYMPMYIMERIQQTVFTLQETVLSCLYIYHTSRFLSLGYTSTNTRKVISLLLCVQVLVVALDATLTAVDYVDWFTLKCTFHPFVYSVKLKLEFIVLNQLQALVRRGGMSGLRLGRTGNLSGDETDVLEKGMKIGPRGDKGFGMRVETNTGSLDGASTNVGDSPTSSVDTVGAEKERALGKQDSKGGESLMAFEEEYDLISIVGRPDAGSGVDEMERHYLGRWDEVKSK